MARALAEAELTAQEVTGRCTVSASKGHHTLLQRVRPNSALHFYNNFQNLLREAEDSTAWQERPLQWSN